MFAVFKRAASRPEGFQPASVAQTARAAVGKTLGPAGNRVAALATGSAANQVSTLCREAAEVRGALDDTYKITLVQAQAVHGLALQLLDVVKSQNRITRAAGLGLESVAKVGDAVHAFSAELDELQPMLREVSNATNQITQIALQTRLLAFSARVQARQSGQAPEGLGFGSGLGVVADAANDLAERIEFCAQHILGKVQQLDESIAGLLRQVSPGVAGPKLGAHQGGSIPHALDQAARGINRIYLASENSRDLCDGLNCQMADIEAEMHHGTEAVGSALMHTETFLKVSEALMETVADSGVDTEDTLYIRSAQDAALRIGKLLEAALQSGSISQADLFDDHYLPIVGSQPAQHQSRFVDIADRLFPLVQEELLGLSDKVVFCVATDRNGYVACHNKAYNHTQRSGEPAYNSVHCRSRRIFNDRAGLASARNQRPFLLQTYRRDMGAGNFVVMKEAAAPITVNGQHWGGLRLAFKF
jgi:methyl-accepting chemotaxis protein